MTKAKDKDEQTDAKNMAEAGNSTKAPEAEVQKSSDPDADAEASRLRGAEQDAEKTNRNDPVLRTEDDTPKAAEVVDPAAALIAQHHQVDEENAKRNERNLDGHEKNMEAIKRDGEAARREYERAPPTGKQRDENTPDVRPDGSKVWR